MSVIEPVADADRRWTHGPSLHPTGVVFRLWAPSQERVSLALEDSNDLIPMQRQDDGFFEVFVEGLGAGALYRFELANGMCVPDPASRFTMVMGFETLDTAPPDAVGTALQSV